MIFAGTPAMTVFSGIEPLTTELAPTTTPLPIIVPGKTVTFSATKPSGQLQQLKIPTCACLEVYLANSLIRVLKGTVIMIGNKYFTCNKRIPTYRNALN